MQNFYLYAPELLILLFTVITFLQSGIDKIMDWNGNIGWLKGHFGETFLSGVVPLLVGIILLIEVVTGLMAIGGIYELMVNNNTSLAFWTFVLAAITLLMLLFGQRVAKDYAGAFTIVGYFMVIIFGLFLISSY